MRAVDNETKAMFHAMHEGIVIIDTQARIVYVNDAYARFIGIDAEEAIGRKLRDLRPGARLPQVLQTGRPILHAPRREGGDDVYFVNMYPVYENRRIIGGISVVTFMKDAFDASKELERVEHHGRQILHRVNKNNSVHYTFDAIVAQSPGSADAKATAEKAATTDAAVMLLAKSGSGKELYAQAIHAASPRSHAPFVAVNCANFSEQMMESELFGYAEGAFTGAKRGGKIGLFEAADGGTIFLDEVTEINSALQAKLLRVLQEGRVRPVGGVEEIEVDVRVISASNANIQKLLEEGTFRSDLFYRLSTFQIQIPPLCERRLDIPILAKDILHALSNKQHTSITITEDALRCLMTYDWPGNVRELRNVLELASYFAENGEITRHALPEQILRNKPAGDALSLAERVRRFEREEIRHLLEVNGESLAGKKKTAQELKISLSSLYNKLAE